MLPLAPLAILSVHHQSVAFTARYYFAGSRRSFGQVYVCDLDGRHRRQLTHERSDCDAVRWDGQSRVTYMVGGTILKEVNIRTGRSRTLLHVKPKEWELESATLRLGRGPHSSPTYTTPDERIAYVVHRGKVSRHTAPRWSRPPLRRKSTPHGVIEEYEGGARLLARDGKQTVWAGEQDAGYLENAQMRGSALYVTTAWTLSTFGEVHELRRADGQGGMSVAGGHEIEADLSKHWIAWVAHRELAGLDEILVWSAGAGVLNLDTGKHATICSGTAWATSIALSPAVP